MKSGLNKYSSQLTQKTSQAASRAMLYGVGLKDDDMNKPQVGIASMGWEGNTCNMHLNGLAQFVKQGVQEAGIKHLPVRIQMKLMEEPVKDGCEEDSHRREEDDSGEQSIRSREDFPGICMQCVHRSHPAEYHGRIDGGVDPAESFEEMVSDYTDSEGNEDQGEGEDPVPCDSSDVFVSWKKRVTAMFEHWRLRI